ncbi:hypothetical protein D3C80_1835480 [compost metagenome]
MEKISLIYPFRDIKWKCNIPSMLLIIEFLEPLPHSSRSIMLRHIRIAMELNQSGIRLLRDQLQNLCRLVPMEGSATGMLRRLVIEKARIFGTRHIVRQLKIAELYIIEPYIAVLRNIMPLSS